MDKWRQVLIFFFSFIVFACSFSHSHQKFSIVEFTELIEYIRTLHINLYPSRNLDSGRAKIATQFLLYRFYIFILNIKSIRFWKFTSLSHDSPIAAIYNQHKMLFSGHRFHQKVQLVDEKMKNSAFYLVRTAKVFVMRKLGFLAGITWLNKHKDGCLPSSDT